MLHLSPTDTGTTSTRREEGYLFRNGHDPRPTDVFVAVMGVTGSGKSTFVSKCCKKVVQVGHHLQACTQKVDVYHFEYSPTTTVYLIDTPGFDDTRRKDTDILRELATWLSESYANKIKLNGIVYLHRITDPRMQGSALRNLYMFKKLCGANALKNVILATTMWEKVDPEDGMLREQDLMQEEDFWGYMVSKGSQVLRLMNNRTSAMEIIDVFASEYSSKVPVALELQEEMVDHQKSLDDTQAGEALVTELREQSERHRRELLEVKEEMKEALAAHDRESAGFLERSQREMERKIAQLQEEREELKVNVQQLIEAKNIMNETLILNNQMSAEKIRKHREDVQLEIRRLHDEREGLENNVRKLRVQTDWAREQQREAEVKQKKTEQKQKEIEEKMNLLRQEQIIRVPYSYMPHIQKKPVKGLSLCGDSFFFLGDPHPSPRRLLHNRLKELFNENDGKVQNQYIVLGEGGSYFYQWIDGNNKGRRSSRLEDWYPDLNEKLKDISKDLPPICISLGQDGHYFARFGHRRLYNLPLELLQNLVNIEYVDKLWLGSGDSYVAIYSNGHPKHNLKGMYNGLGRWLKIQSQVPQQIALNCKNGASWIIVTEAGEVDYRHGFSFKDSHIRKWSEAHLGLEWRADV